MHVLVFSFSCLLCCIKLSYSYFCLYSIALRACFFLLCVVRVCRELKKLLSQCPPQNDDDNNNAEKKHIVILFIYGCDRIFTLKQELLPYNTLLNVIQEQEKEFSKGCLELHLDR